MRSNTTADEYRVAASVLHDLVDVLLAEGLLGPHQPLPTPLLHERLPLATGERHHCVPLAPRPGTGEVVAFRVRPAATLACHRLSRPPVLLLGPSSGEMRTLTAAQLLKRIAAGRPWPNLAAVLRDLDLAVTQGKESLGAEPSVASALCGGRPTFLAWERLAALRDRPFHPTARAKAGWTARDYRRYAPEFGRSFGLAWMGVRRDHLLGGDVQGDVATLLLQRQDCERLREAFTACCPADDFVALPVHPWQLEHVVLRLYAREVAAGICVPLPGELGRFAATSSVRTLAPIDGGGTHVKLPLGIFSLGALRLLPPRYLHNADRAQILLERVRGADPALAARLHLCDERHWWAFSSGPHDRFEDKPGHLGCLVRHYPTGLLDHSRRGVLPLAALAVVTSNGCAPGLDHVLAERGGTTTAAALDLLGEVASNLALVALRCFGYGLMPELHGQNALAVIEGGRIQALLLRDHDTLRIHPPWLHRAGLETPNYHLKPATPNTLDNPSPERLLAWFQTLGVQLSLGAIIAAMAEAYGIDEVVSWRHVAEAVGLCLADLDLPTDVSEVARRQLFEAARWPHKLVLSPLLEQRDSGGGSMPSGLGTSVNPLRRACSRLAARI